MNWIRVGPGKFVRADTVSEGLEQTQISAVSADEHAVTETSVGQSTVPSALDDVPIEVQGPPASLDISSSDEERTIEPDARVPESVTEVYGITPSTFSLFRSDSPSVKDLADALPQLAVIVDADCGSLPAAGSNLPARGVDQRSSKSSDRSRGSRLYPLSERITNTRRRGDRASLRCRFGKGPTSRLLIGSLSQPNTRVRQAMCRTFGRLAHVHRVFRPRSPPCS